MNHSPILQGLVSALLLQSAVACSDVVDEPTNNEADLSIRSTNLSWLDDINTTAMGPIEDKSFEEPLGGTSREAVASLAFTIGRGKSAAIYALPQRSQTFDVDNFNMSAFSDASDGNDAVIVCWRGRLLWSCDPNHSLRGMSWYSAEYTPTKVAVTTLKAIASRGVDPGEATGSLDLRWHYAE